MPPPLPTPPLSPTAAGSAEAAAADRYRAAGLADLSPACFGLVMATGIVSIAAHLLGLPRVAQALLWLNVPAYAVLWLLSAARMARHRRRFFRDLTDHRLGPGFFTTVAGTTVLGCQFVMLADDFRTAHALWLLALALWLCLTYAIFAALTVKEQKPRLDLGINGGWLLAVVATQSIAVLAAMLAAHETAVWKLALNFLALSMWLWGGMLYIWMMSLIFYRYTFFRLSPADLAPPYWINMGAMAISTLAGSLLIINAPHAPFLHSLLPFLKGFTILYWATGTWWIPMLLVLAVWRHGYKRFPFRYDPLYWGAVFPLGMYATCTRQMGVAMGFGFLDPVATVFLYAALTAWVTVFAGLLADLWWRVGGSRPVWQRRPGPR
ncbi:MAG: tellurite resistance/C4-dicarboxylate transporter family protein [Lautropia sp.]